MVVSDTSVISALVQLDKLDLLRVLYERVLIPRKVFEELTNLTDFLIWQEFSTSDWLEVYPIADQARYNQLVMTLDEGEAEAIVLYFESQSNLLLMDETDGRKIATDLGAQIVGVLGVLLKAKESRLISAVQPLLHQLRTDTTFRIAPALYERVLRLANESPEL